MNPAEKKGVTEVSRKNKKKTGNKQGCLGAGAIFFLLGSVFSFSGIIKLLVFAGLSVGIGSIIRIMAQGLDTTTQDQKRAMQQQEEENARKAAEEEKRRQQDVLERFKQETGNADVDTLLERGRNAIREIRRENDLIPDASLSDKLDQLEKLCGSIFQAVHADPSKAGQVRKFMDYYLPTTLKMVRSYRMIDERNVALDEAQNAKKRIDAALGVVNNGCRKLLKNLYKEDMLDITTDIDVLEQMLKRDGLTESDLEMAAEQARSAAKLDTALHAQRHTAAQQTSAAPAVPTFQSGVENQVQNAYQQAQQHRPQVPTISGGYYPAYGNQATQQAPRNE